LKISWDDSPQKEMPVVCLDTLFIKRFCLPCDVDLNNLDTANCLGVGNYNPLGEPQRFPYYPSPRYVLCMVFLIGEGKPPRYVLRAAKAPRNYFLFFIFSLIAGG